MRLEWFRSKSARTFSCLQFNAVGSDADQFCPFEFSAPFGVVGNGSISIIVAAEGSTAASFNGPASAPAGTALKFGEPEVLQPSTEKSPARSAAVGTQALTCRPLISWFHSWLQKKNSFCLRMGPPIEYPQSLRRCLSLPSNGRPLPAFGAEKYVYVFNASLRPL